MHDDSQPGVVAPQPLAVGGAAKQMPQRIAERFVVQRLLGSGASGVVYQVVDEHSGATLALKVLRSVDPAALFRFKSEFRTLATLSHPHLLQLYELVAHGEQWLLTMELVEGTDFLSHVRPGLEGPHRPSAGRAAQGSEIETRELAAQAFVETRETSDDETVVEPALPALPAHPPAPPDVSPLEPQRDAGSVLDEGRLRNALGQLAEGLHALHRSGRLHRDLKPANVLVAHADARVVICDFGLALVGARTRGSQVGLDGSASALKFETRVGELAGTLQFMSPEQARAETLTPASDWYSVGVMLYLALTGRAPFESRVPYAVMLRAKAERRVIPPSVLSTSCPDDLARLTLGLLEPNPRLRAGYSAVRSVLSGEPCPESQPSPARHVLVGREAQLDALAAAFAGLEAGSPVIALVGAPSGMGKSALVEHFLNRVEDQGALVLRGRCYEHEELAYKAIDPLVDALSSYLLHLDAAALQRLVPSSVRFLCALFPALKRVRGLSMDAGDTAEVNAPTDRRRLAFAAFRELCSRLCREQPLVLFIDDLQWGDLDSAAMFKELFRPPHAPAVFVVCAYRSDEVARSGLLEALSDPRAQSADGLRSHAITVGPLTRAESKRLSLGLLRDDSWAAQASELIAVEASGSPFLAQELAAYANEHGIEAVHQIKLESLIRSKLQSLPEACLRLLCTVAVAGRPVSLAIAREAAKLGSESFQALRDLESRRLILRSRVGSRELLECEHDRIREAATQLLEPVALAQTHRALAVAFEAQTEADYSALLVHWRGAGERARARHYALVGAERAEAGLAFARAADLYREGLALFPADDPDVRRVGERLGHALLLAGRGPEAAATFLGLIDGALPDEALRFRMLAATQLMRGGKLREGFAELERADDLFGVRFPRSLPKALSMLAMRRMRIRLQRRKIRASTTKSVSDAAHAKLDALWEIAAAVSSADLLRGNVYGSELMLRALASGHPFHIAGACGLEAVLAAASNDSAQCQRMLDAADAASRSSGDLKVTARVRGMEAICRQLQGRWLDSVRSARESQEMFGRCEGGVSWDTSIMIWWETQSATMTGDIAALTSSVPETLRDAEARGDVYAATSFRTHRSSWAWLGIDRPDLVDAQVSVAEREWAPEDYQFQHWHMTYARAEADLYRGTPAASLERLMREWPRSFLVRQVCAVHADMLYTRARLLLCAADGADEARLIRAAVADGQALIAQAQPWTIALGRMVLASAASFESPSEAERLLREAEALLTAVDMQMHAAAARAGRAMLARDAAIRGTLEQALLDARALGADNPERFLRMLAPIRQLSRS